MIAMRPGSERDDSDRQIRGEMAGLLRAYRVPDRAFEEALTCMDFSRYAECALGRDSVEVLSGGVGQADVLISLARRLTLPDIIVDRFASCVARFPGTMVWLKLSFGPAASHPTMYVNVLQPWDVVLPFLETLPEAARARTAFEHRTGGSSVCLLLAFSLDGPTSSPLIKVYESHDRRGVKGPAPLLVSHRIAGGNLRADSKYYDLVDPGDLSNVDAELAPFIDAAAPLLPRAQRLVMGYRLDAEQRVDHKLYVFRHDVRFRSGSPRRDSIYNAEGNFLLDLGRYADATVAYDNAIGLDPEDSSAHANRGLCHALSGHHAEALEDAEAAKRLEPEMRFRSAEQTFGIVKRIAELSLDLAQGPEAEPANQRGILLFSRGLFRLAAADFERAVNASPDFAEAHNNLGGAYVNLGRFHDAFEACGKAIALDESTEPTNYLLALNGLTARSGNEGRGMA